MKKSIILTLFLGIHLFVFAQIQNPVSWTFESKKISNTEYELTFIAEIEEGSALYSQEIGEGGPVPTKFTFEKANNYKLVGNSQKIKVSDTKTPVKGKVTFMSCNGDRCIPPKTIDFTIELGK